MRYRKYVAVSLTVYHCQCKVVDVSRRVCMSQCASLTQVTSLFAGGVGTLDPTEIVAAASTAEADALAAAWEYSWLPGQGMQLAMAALHDMTGLPWCECSVCQPRHASIRHAPFEG